MTRLVCLCLDCDFLIYEVDYIAWYRLGGARTWLFGEEKRHRRQGHNVVVFEAGNDKV